MFRDASLSSDEMDLVLEKVCEALKKLAPNEVPPLIYQVWFFVLLTNYVNLLGNEKVIFFNSLKSTIIKVR